MNREKRPSGAKQAAEEVLISPGKPEKHTSGAEAHVDVIGFVPGINPRPTARMSFSAACKAHGFMRYLAARRPRPRGYAGRTLSKPADEIASRLFRLRTASGQLERAIR